MASTISQDTSNVNEKPADTIDIEGRSDEKLPTVQIQAPKSLGAGVNYHNTV